MGIASSKFKITSAIRSLILADTVLSGYLVKTVGGEEQENIYPIIAPEGTIGDFIVYYRERYSKDYSKMGYTSQTCLVALAVVSDNYDRAQDIADQVNTVLEGKHGEGVDQIDIRLEDSTEEYSENKYMQILLFNIK